MAWNEVVHLCVPLKVGRGYEGNEMEPDFETVAPLERGLGEEALDYFVGMDLPLFR